MASGFGLTGGPSRCFPFWQETLACYMVNTSAEADPTAKAKCAAPLADYYECLHHTKEARKVQALQAAYRKREASTPRDDAPNAGEIRGLGLLDSKTHSEIDVKHGNILPTFGSNKNH